MISLSCEALYRKDSLKKLLRRFDIQANKHMGQHFLIDKSYLKTVARGAGKGKVALEVGPGPGSLTCLLKARFNKVFAVELDNRFRNLFNKLNPEDHVEFIQGNFLNLELSELDLDQDGTARLVGNIPYNVTGEILKKAVAERNCFSKAVFTTQKEVADRILAPPGSSECGAITYFIQAFAKTSLLAEIPSDAFHPPPEVKSSIIEIEFHEEKKFKSDEEAFFSVVRNLFNYRRKTVRKGFIVSPKFNLERDEVDELLSKAEIDPGKRPEELTLSDYDSLATLFEQQK